MQYGRPLAKGDPHMRTASRPPPEYRSYILRLRRCEGEEARTQFILVDIRDGRRFCFAGPDALMSFLAGGAGARRQSLPASPFEVIHK